MSPLAYSDVGARYAFYVVLGMFGASEWSIRFRSQRRHGGTRRDRGSIIAVASASILGVGAAFVLADHVQATAIDVARWPIFVLGLAVVLLGVAVRQWAVTTLGAFFTIQVQVRPDQSVVDTGPYRWVRHPSYSALVISFVGMGVALENWLSLAVLLVVPTVGLVVRIRVEERALLEALGEPYRSFSEGRARLVPRVW